MASQPLVRKRITPSIPFVLEVEGEAGLERIGFRLNYDFNALVLVEDKTGYSLLSGTIFNHLSVANVSVLFWAAIQSNHSEYAGERGLDAVRSMLTLRNADAVSEAVQECFIQNLPDSQQQTIRAAVAAAKAKAEGNPVAGGASPLEQTTPATA